MCSYNRLNNTPPCENSQLRDILGEIVVSNDNKEGEMANEETDSNSTSSTEPRIAPFVMSDWATAVDNGTRA